MTSTSLVSMAVNSRKWFLKMPSLKVHDKKQRGLSFKFEGISTVNQLLKENRVIQHESLLLGHCTDGLPLFWDLNKPEVGAILIGCDAGCGKTHQLQVMVESVIKSQASSETQIQILSLNPGEWDSLIRRDAAGKFIKGIHAWYDQHAEDNIKTLADLVESRREGRQTEPTILLILDDLDAVEDLGYDAQFNLRYLLEYGPQSNIWVVATINAENAPGYTYWIETFRTKIVGRISSSEAIDAFNLTHESCTNDVDPGEFRVKAGAEWLKYRLPLLGG